MISMVLRVIRVLTLVKVAEVRQAKQDRILDMETNLKTKYYEKF